MKVTLQELLQLVVEKQSKICLFLLKMPLPRSCDTRIKNTKNMSNIIDDLNQNRNLNENCLLVSFDVVHMFPSIDNKMGGESVKNILLHREDKTPPAKWIIDALELYLNCNNSIFNNQHYLQVDDTVQGPHMTCSYNDVAKHSYNLKSLRYEPAVKCWKNFRDDVFVLWEHSRDDLQNFFNSMNSIDSSKKCNSLYLVLLIMS